MNVRTCFGRSILHNLLSYDFLPVRFLLFCSLLYEFLYIMCFDSVRINDIYRVLKDPKIHIRCENGDSRSNPSRVIAQISSNERTDRQTEPTTIPLRQNLPRGKKHCLSMVQPCNATSEALSGYSGLSVNSANASCTGRHLCVMG